MACLESLSVSGLTKLTDATLLEVGYIPSTALLLPMKTCPHRVEEGGKRGRG